MNHLAGYADSWPASGTVRFRTGRSHNRQTRSALAVCADAAHRRAAARRRAHRQPWATAGFIGNSHLSGWARRLMKRPHMPPFATASRAPLRVSAPALPHADAPVRPSKPRLLVLDRDPSVARVVERLAAQLGFELVPSESVGSAVQLLARTPVTVALVDARTTGEEPAALLARMHAAAPGCEVVLMGSRADGVTAVDAIRHGARDYVQKPFDPERLRRVLNHLCEEAGRRAHIFALEAQVAEQTEWCGMIGRSAVMQDLFSLIQRLSAHTRHVLITGETGTGKGLAAAAFHAAGPRRQQPVVRCRLDDAAGEDFLDLPPGSTLLVDDVADLSAAQQARLLDLLVRIDAADSSTDSAVIAVTNRDLASEAAEGRFEPALLERLNAVRLALPALRDRRDDIPYLTAVFVRECGRRLMKSFDGLTPYAERTLLQAHWDGNVRQLRHVIERACMLADGRRLSERELSGAAAGGGDAAAPPLHTVGVQGMPLGLRGRRPAGGAPMHLDQMEREHIVDTLQKVAGNRMAAAKALGISRRALYRRLERHRITQAPVRRPRQHAL